MTNTLADHRFLKMNGLGNEILVLDLRDNDHIVSGSEVRAIAGDAQSAFDQMMVLHNPKTAGTDAFMRIYNNDGSEVGGCGNGTRCVAWAMMTDPEVSRGFKGPLLRLETLAGQLTCERRGPLAFTVDMGAPRFGWRDIPLAHEVADTLAFEVPLAGYDLVQAAAANVGNPHAVFFVKDAAKWSLHKIGPLLEHHPLFPERANISFVEKIAPECFKALVWERGAGATRACGTAACAIAVLACRRGLSGRKSAIELPGGVLDIEWREEDSHILMTGPVELEWEGHFKPELFTGAS